MRKFLLAATVCFVSIGGIGAVRLLNQAEANQVAIEPGWRFTDGNWNYWDPTDRAWYYTNGRNWYTYGDNAWRVYGFDRSFGRNAFRQGYLAPGPDIALPAHKVFVP